MVDALRDSGVPWSAIPVAYFGHVYYHGMSIGETTLAQLGLTGVPIINVENACSSGSTAFWQAYWGITSGVFDLALAFGAEKVPSGPVTVTAENSPARYIGGDHMMAGYALRMKRYMEETGAPASALAQVSLKARQAASMNPYAHRKETYSVEDVLNSRLIADPLTLYQCCPTSEGGAAAVLCAADAMDTYGVDRSRAIRVAAAALTSGNYNGRGSDHSAFSPYRTEPAALQAYEMAGIGPDDVDIAQVHDARDHRRVAADRGAAPDALWRGLARHGRRTHGVGRRHPREHGRRPAGDGSPLWGQRHPHGARDGDAVAGEAGPRQVENARVGVAQCSGAGDVTTVHILTR